MHRSVSVLTLSALIAVTAASSAHASAPVTDVWPSKVRRLEDGGLEYTYDLKPVKSRKVTLDFGPDAEEADAAKFLRSLPDSVTARVELGKSRLRFHAAGGLEDAPLAPSFAQSSQGVFAAPGVGARGRDVKVPALHPDAPHPLPSADLLLWHHRQAQDGAWAALLLAAHDGNVGVSMNRRTFLQRVLEQSLHRAATLQGDSRDGARRLAARLAGVMEATGAPGARPWRSDPELWTKVQEEAQLLARAEPRFPSTPWLQWRDSMRNLPPFDRAVQRPFENTRIGAAAVLTFLAILERDGELQTAWAEHRRLRDRLFGQPTSELIAWYRGALGDGTADAALEDLSPFLARMPRELVESEVTAPLIAKPHTPLTRFLAALEGPEQLHGVEELTVALQDGRVRFDAGADKPWWQAKDAWAQALVAATEDERLGSTPDYRQRLARTMQALLGAHDEIRGGESWLEDDAQAQGQPRTTVQRASTNTEPRNGFRIRLMVPPHLELEPLPEVYAEIARGWQRLAAAAKEQGRAASLKGLAPNGGQRSLTIAAEAQRMGALFSGLAIVARVALGEEAPANDADRKLMREATTFLARWRTMPELRADARYLLPVGEAMDPGTFVHSGVLGIGRRELEVRFETAPQVELKSAGRAIDLDAVFELHARAVQRYQLPVLATGAVTVGRVEPLESKVLREVADREKKRDAIEAALPGTLVRSLQQVH